MQKPPLPKKPPTGTKPGYRISDSTRGEYWHFDTESKEYPTWLLAPAGRDPVSDHIAKTGRYQYELAVLAMKLLPDNGVFLDVGASFGPWAIIIAKARPDVTVEAFEPEWGYFHQLAGNIFLNNLKNVRAHHVAVGSRAATARMYLPDSGNRAGTSLLPETGRAISETPVIALDGHVLRPSVIKLDVEGYEHEVIEGAEQTIRAEAPIIFFESWGPERGGESGKRRAALFALIEIGFGYEIRHLQGSDFVAHAPKDRARVVEALGSSRLGT